jgi:1-acyl-sn-glycerol-3-phosphate acyltransferase
MTMASSISPHYEDERERANLPRRKTFVHRMVVAVCRWLFPLVARMEVVGLEHIPTQGAVVFAANHVTTFDVFPLQLGLPRALFFMGKVELFRFPFMTWIFYQLGGFPVRRGARDGWAMFHAERLLSEGQAVMIFPEGTRSRGQGLAPGKTGAARLAQAQNCPIVPVAMEGSELIFRTFPWRPRVRLVICPPIYPKENDSALGLTDRLMFTLAENLPPHLRGVYADVPKGFGA